MLHVEPLGSLLVHQDPQITHSCYHPSKFESMSTIVASPMLVIPQNPLLFDQDGQGEQVFNDTLDSHGRIRNLVAPCRDKKLPPAHCQSLAQCAQYEEFSENDRNSCEAPAPSLCTTQLFILQAWAGGLVLCVLGRCEI